MSLTPFLFGRPSRSEGKVSIRSSGILFINNNIVTNISGMDVNEINYSLIFIDSEKPIIGIKFTKEEQPERRECRRLTKEKSGVSININKILNHYNVKKMKGSISLTFIQDNEFLIINIEEVIKIHGSDN